MNNSRAKLSANANIMELRSRQEGDLMSEIFRIINLAVSDASFCFSAFVCAFVILTHIDDINDGPLGAFFQAHSDNKIIAFIMKDMDKFFGCLMFVPMSMRVPSIKNMRSIILTSCIVAVILLPPFPIITYFVASVSVLFFVSFRNPSFKMLTLAISGAYLYLEYATIKNSSRFPAPLMNTGPLPNANVPPVVDNVPRS